MNDLRTSVRNETVQSLLDNISAEQNQRISHAPVGSLLTESESSDSKSLDQSVLSTGSVPANAETHGGRSDRL